MDLVMRSDVVRPRGPLEIELAALDEGQLGPAVSWLPGRNSESATEYAAGIRRTIGLGSDRTSDNLGGNYFERGDSSTDYRASCGLTSTLSPVDCLM